MLLFATLFLAQAPVNQGNVLDIWNLRGRKI